jgi:hypothetical protein
VSQRESDLSMLNELLEGHVEELTNVEAEAFASMRFDLTAGLRGEQFHQLTDKQRAWATAVYERVVPQYANLVSRGLVQRGRPTDESRALDAMLKRPIPARPPVRRK